jgi:hypothetical protein
MQILKEKKKVKYIYATNENGIENFSRFQFQDNNYLYILIIFKSFIFSVGDAQMM